MARPRRRRVEIQIGRARMEPEPEIDVQTGRAHDIQPVDETELYHYGTVNPEPDDEVLEGGSIQTRDGQQYHEAMDIQARPRPRTVRAPAPAPAPRYTNQQVQNQAHGGGGTGQGGTRPDPFNYDDSMDSMRTRGGGDTAMSRVRR